jgi:hypothetical protein
MSSDLDLQEKQEEFEQQQREQMALAAATLVVEERASRAAAVQIVKDIHMEQAGATENELIRDEDGFAEYLLEEAQQPVPPKDPKKLAQVKAIAKELIDKFD